MMLKVDKRASWNNFRSSASCIEDRLIKSQFHSIFVSDLLIFWNRAEILYGKYYFIREYFSWNELIKYFSQHFYFRHHKNAAKPHTRQCGDITASNQYLCHLPIDLLCPSHSHSSGRMFHILLQYSVEKNYVSNLISMRVEKPVASGGCVMCIQKR
jgi:hypothetical protein